MIVRKERCVGCRGYISTHNKIVVCNSCNIIYHAKCSTRLFEFDHINDLWLCWKCVANKPQKYNPFISLTYDKHDPNNLEEIDDLTDISNILDSCLLYTSQEFNKLTDTNPLNNEDKSMISVLFNNIDGNASNFDAFLAELGQYKNTFSIIAIAETNIDESSKDLYSICEYNSEYNSKIQNKKKGSGLGLYVHEMFQCNRVEKFCHCSPNLETLFIEITNTEQPVTVGVCYRPPNGNLSDFFREIDTLFKQLPQKNVVLTGDFNINLFSSNSDFEQTLFSNNFVPTISMATHERLGCNPTLIDNILINSTCDFRKAGVLESKISDHHPIFYFFQCNTKNNTSKIDKLPKYDYCQSNVDKFLIDIQSKITECEFEYSEESFGVFNSLLHKTIDTNFITDEVKLGKSRRNRLINPWITNGIIASINNKQFLYKKWKKSCTKTNLRGDNTLYLKYKVIRLELQKIIRSAKKSYYYNKFDKVKGNIKKTWEVINELRGKTKKSIKASFIIDKKVVEDRREISNNFNTFFTSVARKLNTKVCSSTLNNNSNHSVSFENYLSERVSNSILFDCCSESEINEIIKEFESGKASDINIQILKKSSLFLSRHLAGFYNNFIETGVFPTILKNGIITPVFKKGDSRYLDNYRPVSMLPIFGKILEKIIYKRLYSFLTTMGVIYDKQFGFRKNHSTSHAINYSVNKILNEIENKNHVIGVFIDLSKAFDTIDHQKLLVKLEHYGIRGRCHKILESYLSDRTQQTKFQGNISNKSKVEFGVPQGSVLGPLLFLVYINDIVNTSVYGHFVLFADDTNIFVVGKSANEAYDRANIVLNKINTYMLSNQLHINVGKCCYMHFRPRYDNEERRTCARVRPFNSELYLILCGAKLKKVDKVKFLGIIIDDQLTWESQVEHLLTKLNCSIIMIKRIKKFIPKSEYLKIYNALFLSHLTYCISCWGGISSLKLLKVFAIQKRCVRLLFGKQLNFDHSEYYETCARVRTFEEHMAPKNYCLEHTKPIFNEYKLLSLDNLFKFHTFMEVFKILKFHSPISLYELFKLGTRGDKMTLLLPRVQLELSKHNFIFGSSMIWNKFFGNIFNVCTPLPSGLVIPGSDIHSDLATSICVVKGRLRAVLMASQKIGDEMEWLKM